MEQVRDIPTGSQAWFVCRAKGLVGDVMLNVSAKVASDAALARVGRMKAARKFKREHDLHPSTKVECEFQAIEGPDGRLV